MTFTANTSEILRIRKNATYSKPLVTIGTHDADGIQSSTHTFNITAEIGNGAGGIAIKNTNTHGSGHHWLEFYNSSGTNAGEIAHTASTTTAYNTASDYRLKENETPIIDGIDRVKQLKPYRFNFIEDPSKTVDGFFAHEVQGIVDEAITGTKDAMQTRVKNVLKADGSFINCGIEEADWEQGKLDGIYPSDSTWVASKEYIKTQGIDQAKLVPLLTGALQEAITKIETLEAKVTALENA